jgi:hypothetical protein
MRKEKKKKTQMMMTKANLNHKIETVVHMTTMMMVVVMEYLMTLDLQALPLLDERDRNRTV